jgi:hypothetical protein
MPKARSLNGWCGRGDSMIAVESLTVKAAFSFVTNGVIAPKRP